MEQYDFSMRDEDIHDRLFPSLIIAPADR